MNLGNQRYTHEEILKELVSQDRTVGYEYTVNDRDGKYMGMLSNCEGTVSFDATKTVMRMFSGSAMKSELLDINILDESIVPWFCIDVNGDIVKYPLGKFIISPSAGYDAPSSTVGITGYDYGKLLLDDKIEKRHVANEGSFYTVEIQELLAEYFNNYDVTVSGRSRSNAYEWNPGTPKITLINDILTSINYYPIHFNERGVPCAAPYVFPESQPIDMYYKTDKESIITGKINLSSNRFEIPNKFVRYVENADGEYMISKYVNDDVKDPFSISNRGRVISDISSVGDIATQEELDKYTKRCAAASMAVKDYLEFSSLNMPGHGFKNCLFIDIPEAGVSGKYIETGWEMELKVGAEMLHRCIKAVTL